MEVTEPPECPICLVPYDAVMTVPRVLSCGHSICEACLLQIPNPFPNTIRCPSCTQLVKLPCSPSFLPKNIDLLRLSSSLQSHTRGSQKEISQSPQPPPPPFIAQTWPRDFYLKWKNWVLPSDSLVIESNSQNDEFFSVCYAKVQKNVVNGFHSCVLKEDQKLGLVKFGAFMNESKKEKEKERYICNNSYKFNYSYESKIMKVLYLIKESERNELDFILNVSFRVNRVGKAYGFWCDEEDDSVYIAFERFSGGLVKTMGEKENGFLRKSKDEGENFIDLSDFGMIGMEMCEVLNDLHREGFVVGCLTLSCFAFNQFGRVLVDFGEVLVMGRRTCRIMCSSDDNEAMMLDGVNLENCLFGSPELLQKEGNELVAGSLRYDVGYGSDIWSLASLLISLLFGKSFLYETRGYHDIFFTAKGDQKGLDYVGLYTDWMKRIVALLEGRLGPKFSSLNDVLCKCLNFDPANRPVVTDLWKCIRGLVVKPKFHLTFHQEEELAMEITGKCLVLGNLCYSLTKTEKEKSRKMVDSLLEIDEIVVKNSDQVEELIGNGDIVHSVSSGNMRCIDLKGHLDCVTGLAVGGGFLFSSSHDRIINIWSLQDFSLIHSFKGHEDRVTAVAFVDGGEPLCISADKGGAICIWGAGIPFDSKPRKKLLEPKDWRYSGIHAIAISGTQYLYTGSGDKSIKAWSLQDYTLTCTMTGHGSVVSSLAVGDGVLYSGSWDGTVRLWSLSDHNPLAVLVEDIPGKLSSVLSLSADNSMLFVAHEDGSIKIWHDDVLLKSREVHKGAIFSVCKTGKWLFTGGWDKTINVQEVSGDGNQGDVILNGFIATDSVIATLTYWQGKLFVGQTDRVIKVYYSGE